VNTENIECPKCGAGIPITEALARPIVEAERSRLEIEMRQRSTALETRELELQRQQAETAALQKEAQAKAADLDNVVEKRLGAARVEIAAAEAVRVAAQFQTRLDAARVELEAQSAKMTALEAAELNFRKKSADLEEEKRQLELNLARQLDAERDKIRVQTVQDEQKRNHLALDAKDKLLAEVNAKLAESQKAELEVRKQRESLDAEKKALELEVMRRLDGERERVREATQKEEDERHRFKIAEKDKVIDDMRKQVEELRRKSEQNSQQLVGEVQEMELEAILRAQFPRDEFEPVPVGRSGGDLIQKVFGPNGIVCGTILWESKRTKDWNPAWLPKVRDDQRNARAGLSVIVSAALPKGVLSFDRIDDVWVVSFACILPLATVLRFSLTQVAALQVAGQDRSGKTDRMYSYITGQDFKRRVSATVEGYMTLHTDLEREKRSVTAAWARREKAHELILVGTAGLYGDLQGILGKSMPEIEGLEASQIEAPGLNPPLDGGAVAPIIRQ